MDQREEPNPPAGEDFPDSEQVPSSLAEISITLRVANELHSTHPRIAWICVRGAHQQAFNLDRLARGHGVLQFMRFLESWIDRNKNINREGPEPDYYIIQSFYGNYYRTNIRPSEANHASSSASASDFDASPDSLQLTKACQTAVVLYKVITALWFNEDITPQLCRVNAVVEKLAQTYKPYNIIPLDPLSRNKAIRRLPEIEDAVTALRYDIVILEWPEQYVRNGYEDMLDWLQAMFGFQKDNVSNQRENLILLLANVQSRKFPTEEQPDIKTVALDTVMNNLLENYLRWYKFLDLEDKNWSPHIEQKIAPQRKLLYIGLYLLIWGEAANLRFMPECLCYIYHHMAFELFEMLEKRVNEETRERIKPAYGGGDEAFLEKVVTPIYRTIYMEAQRGKGGKHSAGRNYDDLNEYFWLKSRICNKQEWLKETDHVDFFCKILRIHQAKWEKLIASPTNPTFDTIHFIIKPKKIGRDQPEVGDEGHSAPAVVPDDPIVPNNVPHDALDAYYVVAPNDSHDVKKVNFIETRSFLHMFRSFKRMWTFYILGLQTMIIIAWNESGELCTIYQCEVLHQVLSIFITIAILEIIQAILDIYLSWKGRYCMTSYMHLRYFSKAVMAAIWAVVFPITYFSSNLSHSYFIMAISIYVILSMPTLVLFLCPCLETCDNILVKLIMWWYQPQMYVGRGRHKNAWSFIKYTMFWIVLLFFKFLFSYYAEIRPLVGPTKEIMQLHKSVYHLSELFPYAMNQIGIMITLWSPVILVYFMDTQIWYAILSTLTGGVIGFFMRLGEVQTLGMLRTRFQFLSRLFNDCLVPTSEQEPAQIEVPPHIQKIIKQTRFGQMWNTIISSLREEDLIDDREMELLLVPDWKKMDASENEELVSIHWPIFLLANKIPIALELAKYSKGRAMEFKNTLDGDVYMFSAVKECYASFKIILKTLVSGAAGAETIDEIFLKVDNHIEDDSLIRSVHWNALPVLYNQFVQLTEYLEKNTEDKYVVAVIVMKMLNVVILDMMKEECSGLRTEIVLEKFVNLQLPLGTHIEDWEQNIKRLRLLLTVKDSAMDVPSNLEARRRLTFFSNSLLMDIPRAPKIHNMLSFSVLTPYFEEDVLFSTSLLENPNDDGVSILFYLEKIFPDEWINFQERINNSNLNLGEAKKLEEKRLWASYRGQTLTKTVRGMMYYRKALELQASFDQVSERRGYKKTLKSPESGSTISSDCQALADMKFTYVVACQKYSIHKGSGNPRAKDILRLMTTYPSLRVAYIDELVRPLDEGSDEGTIETVYYSTLVKVASETTNPQQRDKAQDQVIYRIKLPGDPIIGEGKPENQNHAIIFTRGEALQTIDMNQDNYIEEAFKMRNLLQEFIKDRGDLQRPTISSTPTEGGHEAARIPKEKSPTILGLREHIFTGSVSSLAWFMSNQENTFVTLGQRVLASPLRVRFHYGHPDVFDRVFHLTRGGVSKASKTINLSEDIFAGFSSILRGGSITHHEYIQVGKGRDVGLNQISVFEAKIANGSGEQTLSRDIYRMGHQFDFFRMLSCYFTTVGFYFCSLLTVLTVYVFLYGRLYLVLSGLEQEMWNHPAIRDTTALQAALTSQSLMQFGFLMAFPMIMAIGLERGFHNALFDIVLMQLQLAPVFFTFQLGTKAHYYSQTLFHGGAKYKATGRGFVVFHEKFSDNYMHYSRSHFVKAFELKILLLVYHMFGQAYMGSVTYFLITFSIWFMVGSWLFAPFLFNPSGFEWHKIVDDWIDWKKWIYEYDFGGFGVLQEKSWACWWEKELQPLQQSGKMGTILEIVFALRFFIFQWGLVSQLTPFENNHTLWVYVVSFSLILIIILIVTVLSRANRGHSTNSQSVYRTFKVIMFITVFTVLTTLTALHLVTLKDIFLCMIAFIITGWGMLLIAQACKHRIQRPWILSSVRTLAWGYDLLMGFLLFIPIALLAWFPFVSDFQTRILFNQAFSRGLQISHILGGTSA